MKNSSSAVLLALTCGLFCCATSAFAANTCTYTDEVSYGDCVKSAADACAAAETDCTAGKNIATLTSAALVTESAVKCCAVKKTKGQKICLIAQQAKLRIAQAALSGVPNRAAKEVFKSAAAEVGQLIADSDRCSSVSISSR